jgi:hypothetical protein
MPVDELEATVWEFASDERTGVTDLAQQPAERSGLSFRMPPPIAGMREQVARPHAPQLFCPISNSKPTDHMMGFKLWHGYNPRVTFLMANRLRDVCVNFNHRHQAREGFSAIYFQTDRFSESITKCYRSWI